METLSYERREAQKERGTCPRRGRQTCGLSGFPLLSHWEAPIFFLLNYYPFPEVVAAHQPSHYLVNCNNLLCVHINLVIIDGKRYMILSAKETPEREDVA